MIDQLIDFKRYQNKQSKFQAELAPRGGNIVFTNSGKGGNRKSFTLSLDSFLECLKDILEHLSEFRMHEHYEEKVWRDLGSKYYQDPSANAQCTVQTKPMFATLSKIIMWANGRPLDQFDPESSISLDEDSLNTAVSRLEKLAEIYTPSIQQISADQQTIVTESQIRQFALKVFQHFYIGNWSYIKANCEIKSTEDEKKHNSISFSGFNMLFGQFPEKATESDLTTSNNLRFFETPFASDAEGYYYFTTQWNAEGDYNLSFANLKSFVESTFVEYEVHKTNESFILRKSSNFQVSNFHEHLKSALLGYGDKLSNRFVASLLAKRFLILTGLSGSGKTKLAQAFVRWISANESQYVILPVASDWTNREPLFGYPNALNNTEYVKPESGVLDLILEAQKNENLPHFLILDEMNLSHVERYFADFLSGIESDERIPLHQSDTIEEVPKHVCLPKNLFVIGTVNIDETTYMFSPKVLDRANVIEFRVSGDEIEKFLNNPVKPNLEHLDMKGASMGTSFAKLASATELPFNATRELNESLMSFFNQLKLSGAEFGYRAAHEIHRLAGALQQLDKSISVDNVIDICIMQKLLPKVHGSRKKMVDVLKQMATLCVEPNFDIEKLLDTKQYVEPSEVKYTLSLEKLHRMYRGAMENGFTSYAEA